MPSKIRKSSSVCICPSLTSAASMELGGLCGSCHAHALCSSLDALVANTAPFIHNLMSFCLLSRDFSTPERKYATERRTGTDYGIRVIISAALFPIQFHLLHTTQPNLLTLGPSTYWFFWCTFMSACVSLSAQGASSFFNPDSSPKSAKGARACLEASLIILLVLAVCFLGILVEFQRRCARVDVFDAGKNRNARMVIYALYASGLFLLARDIFRTVQIFSASNSLVWTSEPLFWVFDAAPLLLCLLVLNVSKPLKLLWQ
jgi:RTA1 like protein